MVHVAGSPAESSAGMPSRMQLGACTRDGAMDTCTGTAKLTGGAKAPMVKDAFSPEPHAPAGLVLASVRTHWLLDAPAAAELRAMEESQADLYG